MASTSRKRTLELVDKHPTGGLLCAFMQEDGTEKLVRVLSTKQMLKLLDAIPQSGQSSLTVQ